VHAVETSTTTWKGVIQQAAMAACRWLCDASFDRS
jgi:hypothetical protein